ncbi:MAG: OmpW family protein [Candidatus Didemnitutus sp.]|nr:OmpW family protein [Candidatus Didemnitutus sp.]
MLKSLTTTPRILGSALAALLLTVSAAAAEQTGWNVRVGATYVSMADKSDAFSALGINFAADSVSVQSKLIPEFDVNYVFNANWSAHVVLTIPQKHEVKLAGVGKLGTFQELPPHFMAVYHFNGTEAFKPYVGAGVNFTLIWNTKLSVAGVPLALEHNSIGLSGQVGFDYDLGNGHYLNVDLKRTALRSDVSAGGSRLTTAQLDPWIFSVGYGWKF